MHSYVFKPIPDARHRFVLSRGRYGLTRRLTAQLMLVLPNYAAVRIAQLRADIDHTPISSSFDRPRLPAVGDTATFVDRTSEGTGYLVEKVRSDGRTEWLALFAEDELELLSDAV